MNYYEHHLGDWAKKTGSLSMIEEGAYRRALDWYYVNERPLPPDIREVFRELRCNKKTEKDAVSFVLRRFFTLTDLGYLNERCDEEIARFQDKSKKAKRSASLRWDKHKDEATANKEGVSEPVGFVRDRMRTHEKRISVSHAPQSPVTSNHKNTPPSTKGPPVAPRPADVDEQTWADWLAVRKAKRAGPITPTIVAALRRESLAAGLPVNEAVRMAAERGWQGFKASWIDDGVRSSSPPRPREEPDWRREQRERMQIAAPYAVTRQRREISNPDDEDNQNVVPLLP